LFVAILALYFQSFQL